MMIYFLVTITLLYYLILWRVTAKKAAHERAAREVFGPVNSIQDLLNSANHRSDSTPIIYQSPSSSKEEIFGAVTNIQELTNNIMSKQAIINSVSLESMVKESPFKTNSLTTQEDRTTETVQEAQLRQRIFAGSSLEKDSINDIENSRDRAIKNTVEAISEKVLEAELDAIVDELDVTMSPEPITSSTNNTLPFDSLPKSDLIHQLNSLFEKDYQDYV